MKIRIASFLLKSDLLLCNTSDNGNHVEPSPTKKLGWMFDTQVVHAHVCPNVQPNYHHDAFMTLS